MARTADPLERRRKELLSRATQLFARNGFHGTSMGDLAADAKVNKGTLYHYFERKSDILYDIFRTVSDDVLARLHRISVSSSPAEQLREVVRAQLEIIAERPEAVRVYYRETSMLSTWMPVDQLADIRAREALYTNRIVEIIRLGVASGAFRPVDTKLAAFGVIGIGAWASTWYDPSGTVKVEPMAALYADILLRGLESAESESARPRRRRV